MTYEKIAINLNIKTGFDPHQDASVEFFILDTPNDLLIKERPMVVICPGGGYAYRSNREAEPIITQFLAAGFHCALMNYSVAPAKWPCSARELARAVELARINAKKWKIKADRIYVCGFSAGGHLAATLGTIWNDELFYEEFNVNRGENTPAWRPDGMILAYPVITMQDYTHEGSRDCLLGEKSTLEERKITSLENRVTKDTVPAFIWHTMEDGSVPVENSLNFACQLRKEKVPFELHVFEHGGHGLSLANELTATGEHQLVPANEGWIDMAITWIKAGV